MTSPRRGRRRTQTVWPTRIPRTRRRLGRMMLILGAGIALSVLAAARTGDSGVEPPATPTPAIAGVSSATATAGVASAAPGSVRALERRSDGWYLAAPEAWPLVAVERVVDGDTLDVRAAGQTLRVRVYGINTPERGEACFSEATNRLQALAGSEVRLVADARQQDTFQRELRYLFTSNGRSIDAALLDEGYARAWRDDGALLGTLVPIEDAARTSKRGCLWN